MTSPPDLSSLTSSQKDALIMMLIDQINRFEVQIKELEARLGTNSRNSSKPPSGDGYDKPAPKSRRGKSGRPSGGQPGHKGTTLKRVAEPDHVVEHEPVACAECGHALGEVAVIGIESRQVFDLPPQRLEVTEHRGAIKCCPCCAARCRAVFPVGVDHPVQYGPHVQATAVYLSQYQLLPYARLAEAFADLYGIQLSQGTLDSFLLRTSDRLDRFDEQVKALLVAGRVVHFDESGVRVGRALHWLHVASTMLLTCYLIHSKRGVAAMKKMGVLGVFGGYAVHDSWSSYFTFDGQLHVLCNAHHLRELIYAHEQHGQRWAEKLIRCLLEAKQEVDAARVAGQTALQESRIDAIERRYRRILNEGRAQLPPMPVVRPGRRGRPKRHKVANLHERLTRLQPEALAFVYDLELPFDNNLAERDVRKVKTKQKVSGCFRSARGAASFCRMRGFISTARKQGRNEFGELSEAIQGRAFDPSTAITVQAG